MFVDWWLTLYAVVPYLYEETGVQSHGHNIIIATNSGLLNVIVVITFYTANYKGTIEHMVQRYYSNCQDV
jgi:hypothetical protein